MLEALAFLLALALASPAQELPAVLQPPFEEGVQALKGGKLAEAEALFRRVLAGSGGDVAYVHNNLGIVYQRRGEHAKAVEQFRAAARLDTGYVAPRILHLRRIREIDPHSARLYQALAQIHLEGKRWAEAREAIERELRLVPKGAGARALEQRLSALEAKAP